MSWHPILLFPLQNISTVHLPTTSTITNMLQTVIISHLGYWNILLLVFPASTLFSIQSKHSNQHDPIIIQIRWYPGARAKVTAMIYRHLPDLDLNSFPRTFSFLWALASSIPGIYQAYSHLKTFAFAVSSFRRAISLNICMVFSLTYFKFLAQILTSQCHSSSNFNSYILLLSPFLAWPFLFTTYYIERSFFFFFFLN